MLTKIKELLTFLSPLPLWLRHLIAAVVGGICAVLWMFSVTSCGTPKTVATVQNVNPNSTVTVTMSVSNTNTNTPNIETSIPLSDGITR